MELHPHLKVLLPKQASEEHCYLLIKRYLALKVLEETSSQERLEFVLASI